MSVKRYSTETMQKLKAKQFKISRYFKGSFFNVFVNRMRNKIDQQSI